MAEVQAGAGTATVTRMLAEKVNEGAAQGDRVSGEALKQKVFRHEGVIGTNRTNNTPVKEPPSPTTPTEQIRAGLRGSGLMQRKGYLRNFRK
ncbi:hypothetical protein JCM14469_26790 [Desulfatiferula olefinivorans]